MSSPIARRLLAAAVTACTFLTLPLQAAPPAPAHVAIQAAPLAGQVQLTWDVVSGATGYKVRRATTAAGTYTLLGTVTGASYLDTTAVAGTRYFYRVTAEDGTGEGIASLTVSTMPAIVVDNSDASGVTITGAWSTSNGVPGFYGTNYLLDGGTGSTGGKSVRFTPTLPVAGRYDVYARWTVDPNRGTNVPIDVDFTAGRTTERVNQELNGGTWVRLGAFDFAAGTAGSVRVRNDGSNGWVVADAVQFVLNEQPLAGYTQTTFVDEFDGTAYDPAVWAVYDNRPNNTVSGGQLRLGTTLNGTEWVTGGLYTRQFMQRFGYFETVMQVARDDGLNNAFWLYTPFNHDNSVDKLEIDITEAHFHDHNHTNVHDWQPVHVSSNLTLTVPDIYPGYHVVGLEWTTSGELRWFWDGALVRTMSASQVAGYESMTPMQVMFSTKVIPFAGTPGPLLNGSSMDIANVRVWMKPGWLGAVDGNWGTVSNWGPDGVPAAGDAAVFNRPTTRTTVSLAGDKSVKELYFATPECPPMTLAAGSFKILLGALASGSGVGGIGVNGDVTTAQTINTAIEARNDLALANYSTASGASLNVNGALTSNATGRALVLAGNGRVNVGGSISAQFATVTKVNGGAAWLTAPNAFTGAVTIENGELVVAHADALGTTSGATVVANGGTLALAGGVQFTKAETVRLAGNGDGLALGALDVADDSAVSFAGNLVLDAAARIASGSGSGQLTVQSPVDTGTSAFALSFAGSGTTIMNGAITGAGSVTKTGPGTLQLNGIASHTGTTTVAQGTLRTNLASLPGPLVNNATVIFDEPTDRTATSNWGGTGTYIKTGAGTLTVAGAMTTPGALDVQGGTVKLGAAERFTSSLDLRVGPGATFDLNAFTESFGPVVLDGGSIINSTGDATQFVAGASYEVRSGTASARLGGAVALVKITTGTATLSGANTFTGGSTVEAGTLELAGSLASGIDVNGGTLGLGATTGVRTVGGNVALNAGGTLRIRINGTTAGAQHDQLRLTGSTPALSLGSTLQLVAAPGLAVGSTFRIIDLTAAAGSVSGTFAGLPANRSFQASGYWWLVSYAGGTGNDVVLTLVSGQQAWRYDWFGTTANSGPAADTTDGNADGEVNLLEFATAQSPSASTTAITTATRSGASLELTYTRSRAAMADGLLFTMEWSDTLATGSWSSAGVTEQILTDNGTVQTVKATVAAGSGRRFCRLKVVKP